MSDPDNTLAKRYDAFGKKMMYGKDVEGTLRSTFLIDERGKVAASWSPMKVDGRTAQVLAALGVGDPAATQAKAAGKTVAAKKPTAKKPAAKKPASNTATPKDPAAKVPAAKKATAKKRAAKKVNVERAPRKHPTRA